jgi:pimeloyl-ACP methyl ester carboxylesterase
MKKVYFISGLGADRTVFDKLDLSFCQPIYLDWITPLEKESLEQYALRLAEAIKEKDAVIVGLSMGGMMASTIANANPAMKAIIISSNKCATEFPAYTRFLIKYLPLYQLSNKLILRLIFPITAWMLGAKNKADKQRLWEMIERRDMRFLKWCIRAIGRWKLSEVPSNVVHIHGTTDKLLPFKNVKPDYTIEKAEHLMVRTHAKEISALLKKLIQ